MNYPFNKHRRYPPSQGGRVRAQSGFTLVELLLAMTLMSILLGLTYSGLSAAMRASERGEAMLAAAGEIRSAHQFVRRQLNQMLPLPFAVSDDAEQVRILFEGDANHIQYVAPMPGYLGSGGPQVQLLELDGGGDDGVLQFSHSLLQGFEQSMLADRDPVLLLQGVSSATFEFLGRDDDGEIMDWSPSWNAAEVLPIAIRLNIEFADETRLGWPELIAGIRVDEQAVSGGAGRPTYEQTIQDLIQGKGQNRRE
jgi:general secretion pathway protein J